MMQKLRDLHLTTEQIKKAKEHGLTFSPRARNRMVCNQAQNLGRVTAKQAEALRNQVWARHHEVRPVFKPVMVQEEITVLCPYCRSEQPCYNRYCTKCYYRLR